MEKNLKSLLETLPTMHINDSLAVYYMSENFGSSKEGIRDRNWCFELPTSVLEELASLALTNKVAQVSALASYTYVNTLSYEDQTEILDRKRGQIELKLQMRVINKKPYLSFSYPKEALQ
jgi:hypothetical protein